MTAYAGLAILHASVAAVLIEALLRVWRVGQPAERIALRWLVLLAPLVLTPVYALVAPFRTSPAFTLGYALLSHDHWNVLTVFGLPVPHLTGFALAAVGLVLFLRDAGPWVAWRFRIEPEEPPSPGRAARLARLERLAGEAASALGTGVPRLRLVASEHPVLLCTGVDRPTIDVSPPTLDLLDDEALGAALLHEFAHARARDPLHGWLLVAVRALQVFNPVAHVEARLIVQDIEERTDQAVARARGAAGLARAIARLSAADRDGVTDLNPRFVWQDRLFQAQSQAVADRCTRVGSGVLIAPDGLGRARIVLASAGVAALVFLVV